MSATLTAYLGLVAAIALVTGRRIRLERAALARHRDYERSFAGRHRLLP